MLVSHCHLFLQPESIVIHTAPFADAAQNLHHVKRVASEILSDDHTRYLKPTDGSLGERVVQLQPLNGKVRLSSADRTLTMLREYSQRLASVDGDSHRRTELIRQHPLGPSFFMQTGLSPGSDEDLLVRLLTSSPRWLLEDEIPGSKVNHAPCEIRFICIYSPETERIEYECHYAKIGGSAVAANLKQGGTAMAGEDLIAHITGWDSSTRQAWLEETGQRARLLAEFTAGATRRPESLSVAIDVMPQERAGVLLPWFLEINTWCYQTEGLLAIDPAKYALVEHKRSALTSLLQNKRQP